MKSFIFPGQGSQKKGMGKELFPDFPNYIRQANEILGYSIERLCIDDRQNDLNQTEYTQPALFVVNALSYFRVRENYKQEPDYVAGHSLGEYNALLAAGVIDFQTGLRLVKKRGELMGAVKNGSMAAILGMDKGTLKSVIQENGFDQIEIANINTPSQIVLSGDRSQLESARKVVERNKAYRCILLKVSGAFHSKFMTDAKRRFATYLDQISFSPPEIPVISNVTARPYLAGETRRLLASQINSPVRWMESVRYMWGKGVERFIEIGPGSVLTSMVKTIKEEATPLRTEKNEIPEQVLANGHESFEDKYSMPSSEKLSTPIIIAPDVYDKPARQRLFEPGSAAITTTSGIAATSLGCWEYKKDYCLKYAYATGGMVYGIASEEMVVKMGKSGMIGYFGTGALPLDDIEKAIIHIQSRLDQEEAYGMNLLFGPEEEDHVSLYLKYKVPSVEAAAYIKMTPALVRYRLNGLSRYFDGSIQISNRIMGKLSRPEVAVEFMSPAPEGIVARLLEQGVVTREQAELARGLPMADDICVEADSGGHTDMGVASALIPTMIHLRDEMMKKHRYSKNIRIGAAGGIGTPEAAASAFIMGADFILTGSINQCSVEAGTSDLVKDMLQEMNVQDTAYAPAGDMFEIGSRVQVLKKGVFFPARANKLYELYRHYDSLEDIDGKTRMQLERNYFKRTFNDVYGECKRYYPKDEIRIADQQPKKKMAMIFKWYFNYANRLALEGNRKNRVDFQVYCGPALGAFNQWVKGTSLENWRNRHVDQMGKMLLEQTSKLLNKRFRELAIIPSRRNSIEQRDHDHHISKRVTLKG